MTAGRDPVDRLLDLAIAVPVCTAVAVRRSLPVVVHALRRGLRRSAAAASPVLTGVEDVDDSGSRYASGARLQPPVAADRDGHAGPGAAVRSRSTSRSTSPSAEPSHPPSQLAIEGYDHLAARQVVDRLGSLEPAELERIAEHERAHRHRSTILSKIAQLTT
jgi:hypothetical protein